MNSVEIVHIKKSLRTIIEQTGNAHEDDRSLLARLNSIKDAPENTTVMCPNDKRQRTFLTQGDELIVNLGERNRSQGSGV